MAKQILLQSAESKWWFARMHDIVNAPAAQTDVNAVREPHFSKARHREGQIIFTGNRVAMSAPAEKF